MGSHPSICQVPSEGRALQLPSLPARTRTNRTVSDDALSSPAACQPQAVSSDPERNCWVSSAFLGAGPPVLRPLLSHRVGTCRQRPSTRPLSSLLVFISRFSISLETKLCVSVSHHISWKRSLVSCRNIQRTLTLASLQAASSNTASSSPPPERRDTGSGKQLQMWKARGKTSRTVSNQCGTFAVP